MVLRTLLFLIWVTSQKYKREKHVAFVCVVSLADRWNREHHNSSYTPRVRKPVVRNIFSKFGRKINVSRVHEEQNEELDEQQLTESLRQRPKSAPSTAHRTPLVIPDEGAIKLALAQQEHQTLSRMPSASSRHSHLSLKMPFSVGNSYFAANEQRQRFRGRLIKEAPKHSKRPASAPQSKSRLDNGQLMLASMMSNRGAQTYRKNRPMSARLRLQKYTSRPFQAHSELLTAHNHSDTSQPPVAER